MTARQQILRTLALSKEPIPIHGFGLVGISETAISARLRELAREQLVLGVRAAGKPYKLWSLNPATAQEPK